MTALHALRSSRPLVLALLLLLCAAPLLSSAGCSRPAAAQKPGSANKRKRRTSSARAGTLLGFIIARKYTTLRAPKNVFMLGGWRSISHWTKLLYLAPEGKKVKKGALVARFQFRHEKARSWIEKRIRKVEAEAQTSEIAEDKKLSDLLSERNKAVLSATTARLDTLKGALVSKNQLEVFKIIHKQALFEIDAVTQRIKAQRKQMRLARAYYKKSIERERSLMTRYHAYKNNYVLRAPHDGVVRHAYHRRRRRKVRKGDGMPAGLPVLHLGHDERLAVRFFVPEHHLREVRIGDTVTVVAGRKELAGKVFRIERFPQEMGFLQSMDSDELPNAREKAFVVVAEIGIAKLTAGNEVRVRLSAPDETSAPRRDNKRRRGGKRRKQRSAK